MPVCYKAVHSKECDIPPLPQPRQTQNLVVKAAPKRPKSPSSRRQQHKAKIPPRRVYISSNQKESNSTISSNEFESASEEFTTELHNNVDGDFCVVKHDHVLHAQPLHNGVVMSRSSIDSIRQSINIHDIVLQLELQREDVLHAKPSPGHVQPRPFSVPMNGLYILIMETADQWVPKNS